MNLRESIRTVVKQAVFSGPTVHCGKLNFEYRNEDNITVSTCRGCGHTFYARGEVDLIRGVSVIRQAMRAGKLLTIYARGTA